MRSKLHIRDNMLQAPLQRGPLSLQMLVLLNVLPAAQIPRLSAAAQYNLLIIASTSWHRWLAPLQAQTAQLKGL